LFQNWSIWLSKIIHLDSGRCLQIRSTNYNEWQYREWQPRYSWQDETHNILLRLSFDNVQNEVLFSSVDIWEHMDK
jgi:hypothetical protein